MTTSRELSPEVTESTSDNEDFAPSPSLVAAAEKLKNSFKFYDPKLDIFYSTNNLDENTLALITKLEKIEQSIDNTKMSSKEKKKFYSQLTNLERQLKPTNNSDILQHNISKLENDINKKKHSFSLFSIFTSCLPYRKKEQEMITKTKKLS